MDISRLFHLDGKVALVTGGSRGIGYMIAEGLLSAGVKVYICSRKKDQLAAAQVALSQFGECVALCADVGEAAECAALVEAIGRSESQLDIIVNNAGMAWTKPIEEFSHDKFEQVLSVNVAAPFELTRLCLPLLRKAATEDDAARIVNIASLGGIAAPSGDGYAYSASKAAVIMLTHHLARRLARENITVNAIAPGVFYSRMTAPYFDADRSQSKWDIPLKRIGAPEDIAGAVIYLCSRAGAYLTGAVIPLTGGMEFTV